MAPQIALIGMFALLVSMLATGIVRRLALSHGVLDVPNERSSHSTATPRGGGAAVVAAFTAATVALLLYGALSAQLFVALFGGGLAVALVGFLDDRYRVRAGVRLTIHLGAALWALAWLGGMPPLRIGEHVVQLGLVGPVLATLGLMWTLNFFNFMDGIDGIAASEAVFVTGGAALLSLVGASAGMNDSVGLAGLDLGPAIVFGAACCGFLIWNWPPAKIFMGDVGSGYTGYVIAVLALSATRTNPAALWSWLILSGLFFVDATVTLVRRTLRGERVQEAHRSHAYQWLARRWRSHRRVTLLFLTINLLWLLPCAALASLHPTRAAWITCIALAPLVPLALAAGAGRRETATP